MKNLILNRLKESFISILPFFLIILFLHFSGILMIGSVSKINGVEAINIANLFTVDFYNTYYLTFLFSPSFITFLISFPLMVIGMSFYGLGADSAIEKMGSAVGSSLTKKKSIVLLFIVTCLIGTLLTFAEPDLTLFSSQIMGEDGKYVLISIISIGIGVLLALAFVRIIFQWNYKYIIYTIFIIVFGLGVLVNKESFWPIVFDGSGVTVGSMTVPFVLAMGISVAQLRGGKNAEDDSFGISGLASLGPLIVVFLWAKITEMSGMNPDYSGLVSGASAIGPESFSELGSHYLVSFLDSISDVAISILPLIAFFIIYDLIFLRLEIKELIKIGIGLLETFFGLTIFMIGINSGFMIVARQFGTIFASTDFQNNFYLVIIICLMLGILIILAEPSVHVLGKQIEEVSRGSIKIRDLYIALCIGVCGALLLGILRIQYEWKLSSIVIPLIIIYIILSLIVPNIYTAISLDSSGVASSTMASAFLLPLAISFATSKTNINDFASEESYYEYLVTYGTGMIGLVFICSLVAIEFIGVYGKSKEVIRLRINKRRIIEPDDNQIIHLPNNLSEEN